ncbi:MAG: nucleotidyltransferase domain-containing protein [Candidatus Aminicenantales bacterium]
MDERWLSVDDVSKYLGIRPGTVYKWVERRGLPSRKIGRLLKFRRSEIDAWMEGGASDSTRSGGGDRLVRLLRDTLPDLKTRFGVSRIGLFGSAARGEAKPGSDIDILVEFDDPTFDRYMDLKFRLEGLLGRKCDLVLADSLKSAIRENILSEVVYA